ncbi:unnamed protein product [Mycena citricolor]|uniref:BTB domain-containing protein n=1 Tax=Mycena citricolor TaxID=2018698 RepID=A0AAD2HLL6_9AGAR|nr:unnamed protein product [Mycena citricolor]
MQSSLPTMVPDHQERAPVNRVSDLWFSQGMVVLQAEDTVFRVSRAILAARSTVFESMFGIPQPPVDETETLEGTQVVVLHDRKDEVEVFLRAIFDSSFFMPPPAPVGYDAVLGILRLAHKYDVGYLLRRAVLHLETAFCTRRGQYDPDTPLVNSIGYIDGVLEMDLRAIAVFECTGVKWLLPWAYYSAGTYSHARIKSCADWHELSQDVQHTLLSLAHIHSRATIAILSIIAVPVDECPTKRSCSGARLARMHKELLPAADPTQRDSLWDCHPFFVWRAHDWAAFRNEVCDVCVDEMRHRHAAFLDQLWDQLPANCGLEDWDALLAERKRMLDS